MREPARRRTLVLLCLTVTILAAAFAGQARAALCLPILCTPGGGSGSPPAPGPPAASGEVIGTVSAYANPARTGYVADPSLVPPFNVRWARVVRHGSGQTMYGDGRVFVILDGSLRALDPATGKDLWSAPLSGSASLQSYDAGRVLVLDPPYVRAFSASTGQALWAASSPSPGGFDVTTRPVAAGGMVYVSAGTDVGNASSDLFALDGATGQIRWLRQSSEYITAPTVAGGRVFEANYGDVQAWDAGSGQLLWTVKDCLRCGRPMAYDSGRLYGEDGSVLDAGTGARVATSPDDALIADGVGLSTGYVDPHLRLTADDVGSGRRLWQHAIPEGGFDLVESAVEPLIAGGAVYTLRGLRLTAFGLHSGQRISSANVPLVRATDTLPTGEAAWLGAAPGLLLVSGRRYVLGLESAFHPATNGVQVDTTATDILSGRRMDVGGELGSALRAANPAITVQEDLAPFGGGWHTIGHPSANSDGFFQLALRPDRNVRLRALAGGATAKPVTVYAYPRYHFHLRLSGHRLRIAFSVTGPRSGLNRRRAVIYLGRVSKHRYQRLGSGVLHGRHGRFHGVAHSPVPTHTHTNDVITLCVKGGPRLGLGRAGTLDRHCGARSVRIPR